MNYDNLDMLILQGISGSGKSTFAKELAKKNPAWVIINRDTIRTELMGPELLERYFKQGLDYSVEQEVTKLEHFAIAKALASGRKVIVDDTNLQQKYVTEILKVLLEVKGLGELANVEIQQFDASVDEAEKRIQKRGERFVSRQVLQSQYDRFKSIQWTIESCIKDLVKSGIKHWYLPKFEVEPYVPNITKPQAIICDIDGTLAHRRLLTIPKIHYRSFFSYVDCITDAPDLLVAKILKGLEDQGVEILFVSGRKEDAIDATNGFIRGIFGPDFHYQLFTRDSKIDRDEKNHDGPDDKVKHRLFNTYIRDNYNVIGVIDDRKKVVAFWEALGLRVLNVGLLNEEF